jgi:hypothetical protein
VELNIYNVLLSGSIRSTTHNNFKKNKLSYSILVSELALFEMLAKSRSTAAAAAVTLIAILSSIFVGALPLDDDNTTEPAAGISGLETRKWLRANR